MGTDEKCARTDCGGWLSAKVYDSSSPGAAIREQSTTGRTCS